MPKIPKFSPAQMGIVVVIVSIIAIIGLLVYFNIRVNPEDEQATVVVWGFEPADFFEKPIDQFAKLHRNIEVSYRQINPENYHDALINALAAGAGPDVFMFADSWLAKNRQKVSPLPADQLAFIDYQKLFPQVTESDFTQSGQIYALPLYLDTLALIYNKNLFDQTATTQPPASWDQMKKLSTSIRMVTGANQIVRAAAAIGGSQKTVDAGVDLLECMMLQNTLKENNQNRRVVDIFTNAGGAAADTYLEFANPVSPFYTWNESQQNSLENFASEKTAIIFNYKSGLDAIRRKNPFINVGVAPLPQFAASGTNISCPRYWGLSVSKQASNAKWAWNVALYLTTDEATNGLYLQNSGHPPALRSLIAANLSAPEAGVFARQALTARSREKADDEKITQILNTFIVNVLSGQVSFGSAFEQARNQIGSL